MLCYVQYKSSRSVARPGATGFEFLCFALVWAMLASPAVAYTHSRADSTASWNKRVLTKPERELMGRASWYGPAVAGHKTATGERMDPNQLTAASTQLPLQSSAMVTNLNNGRSVPVRINDCGPYAKGRDIDVSKRAAQKLAMAHSGTVPVTIKLLAAPPDAAYCPALRPAHRRVHAHIRRRRF